ncbi:hypothetical protein QFZ62_002838 [Clavibacter sp. B3I6]|uniref:DUF6264 family protein n=1 Tax=Clavibacter sp. B3I6 TaxID=3042268 RepID=UPI0027834608|nr:DUF6264 family protein [Clavibacter sp. B3I6]MDQ0745530.1 hypothetical protein [Clavibacter sp. B3I6]
MSDDDGTRRPGRPAPRYGEYASPAGSASGSDSGSGSGSGSGQGGADASGLSEADARIVAEAAEYRRAQAERDAPASAPARGARKAGKSSAPQTLAEQMAEERRAARERMLAERREAEKAAEVARREARRSPAAKAPARPAQDDAASPAGGARPERPAYLAGQDARRAPRRFDAAITIGLLAAGLFNVVGSISSNADLGRSLNQSFALFGFGEYTATPQTAVIGIALNVVNVVVFVVTAWIALELVKRRRMAFWVPLAGAALAALIGVILLATLVMGDPSFLQQLPGSGRT